MFPWILHQGLIQNLSHLIYKTVFEKQVNFEFLQQYIQHSPYINVQDIQVIILIFEHLIEDIYF